MRKTNHLLFCLLLGLLFLLNSCNGGGGGSKPPAEVLLTTRVSPSGAGTVTVDPSGPLYDLNSEVTLTATANNDDYLFSQWSGDLTGSENPVTIVMDKTRTITANFVRVFEVTVNSPRGAPDPPVGTTTYPNGSSVTVSCGQTPYAGPAGTRYVNTGWIGGTGDIPASGTATSVTFTITQDCEITWTWPTTQYSLRTAVLPTYPVDGGTVVAPSGPWYDENTSVELTAVAADGFEFDSWSGDLTGTTNPGAVVMNSAKTVTANFSIQHPHTITVTSPYGEPNPPVGQTDCPDGSSPTIDCGPNPYVVDGTRYICTGWTGGSGDIPAGPDPRTSYTFTITQDSTITWTWRTEYQLTITVDPPPGGSVMPLSGGWYNPGDTVTLTATPANLYYSWLNWSGDLSGSVNPTQVTMNSPKNITANFLGIDCTVTVAIGGPPLTEGFESGNISGWTNGTPAWRIATAVTHSGSYSAQSGSILDGGNTFIQREFSVGPEGGSVSFWWKVSSEENHDYLEFYIDDVLQTGRISGETGWAQATFPLTAGTRTLKWRYVKDSANAGGSDCGWIDDITAPPSYGEPTPSMGTTTKHYGDSVTVSCGTTPYRYPDTLAGVRFACTGWTGGSGDIPAAGTETSYTIAAIHNNSAITWTWQTEYYLLVSISPSGSGTAAPPTGWYAATSDISLSATPGDGYSWLGWSGDLSGTQTPVTVTIDGPKSITANFAPIYCGVTVASPRSVPKPPVGTTNYLAGSLVTVSCGPSPYYGTFTEGFEAGDISGWTTGGDANWSATDIEKHSGDYSARSGVIADSQSSYIERAFLIAEGDGTVTFWWKVSSESGGDFLKFYIDGVEQAAISGEVAWELRTYSLAEGTRTIRWAYAKNSAISAGSDHGWIDDIAITNIPASKIRYSCTGWVGGTGNIPPAGTDPSYIISTISVNSTITWLWKTQYQLTIAVNPLQGGSVPVTPPASDGWYDAGTQVSCQPTPAAGYGWVGWSGDVTGMQTPLNLTMNSAWSVTAGFIKPELTVSNPLGVGMPQPGQGTYVCNYNAVVTCYVTSPVLATTGFTEGFEAGNISGWTTGSPAWHTTTAVTHSGSYCAQSGTIGNNANTYIQRDFCIGPGGGAVTFWWKVSSQQDHDYLEFYIDDVLQTGRISGEINWTQATYTITTGGIKTLKWRYVKDSSGAIGTDRGWIDDITVAVGPFTEGFEAGNISGWTTGWTNPNIPLPSRAAWRAVTPGCFGIYSAQSGLIYDNEDTYIEKTFPIEAGGGTVSFWWRVSSETTFDFLEFYIDDQQMARISGEQAWTQPQPFALAAGIRRLRWRYMKDGSRFSGSDCGWIDEIVVSPSPPDLGTRYTCTGYTGTGSVESGAGNSVTFAITQNSSITWNWRIDYRLTVNAAPPEGGSVYVDYYPPSVDGYYTDGSVVALFADANIGYVFNNWSGDLTGSDNPCYLPIDGPKTVTANFAAPNQPSNFSGTAVSTTAIRWSWTSNSTDWQEIAAGVLRTVAATLTPPLPESETCPRDDESRVLFGTIDVSGAVTYTIAYTKDTNTIWHCTADTNLAYLNDYYINQTGVLREKISIGDGPQADATSSESFTNVWFEIQDSAHAMLGRVYLNITSWQETSRSENTYYTRHVHELSYGSYSTPSNNASLYTLIHDAAAGDFQLALDGSTVTITVTPPPNSTSGSTGVLIERAPDDSFTTGTVTVQGYAATYTKTDMPGSGLWYYRIRFRNGDGVESAYSAGQSCDVP